MNIARSCATATGHQGVLITGGDDDKGKLFPLLNCLTVPMDNGSYSYVSNDLPQLSPLINIIISNS